MSKNIFEPRHDIATPIAGLTCKPLSILPETISPQEMSLARGGNGDDDPYDFDEIYDPLDEKTVTTMDKIPEECPGNTYDCAPGPELLGTPGVAVGFGGSGGSGESRGTGQAGGILGESYTAPADSSASVDTTTSADSSGTQDQNGGALDNVEEEDDYYDLIDPDDYEDWEYFVDEWDTEEGSSGYEGVDVPEQMFQ